MRLTPILIALLVAASLYVIVFERDTLLNMAGVAQSTDQDETTAQSEEEAAVAPTDSGGDDTSTIAVVVLQSNASDIDNAVNLRGQTRAVREVDVQSQTSGLVISEPHRKGSFVERGDVLCQIDPGTRPAQLAEAQARLAEAEINDNAAGRLAEGGFASETRAVSAKAMLQSAQAAVQAAETEIDRLTITAPFGGLLETDAAEIGSLLQPGSLCATIIQLDPIKLVGFAPETSVGLIEMGAPAVARLPNGENVSGQVTFISRAADPATRTFGVEITAENPDLKIRDGQSADISVAASGTKAHLVPPSALTLNDQGTMGLRIVDENDVVQFTPVSVIRDTIDGVYVTGLPETARVIVVGQEYVSEGVKVRVSYREAKG
ncbi:efflux RND transporter periplasmic adaptor subunit [Qingshengfaniella alkalisoli]|uniref:Efflux RND transporter periplasmic adaptor subunit n=1 Tax=Qingshengfaniella alkalisoli TaxID=2599296 RepID=A0A5B8ITP9_9RHOB|nr:efflux RND transporter periplasmic adaptor subunit [Qingshengfaniella alkalisoli]QDY68984.1 efflux RND transporter periplasmic adaptor subunit [Qingshengfaniella alkalisoli]